MKTSLIQCVVTEKQFPCQFRFLARTVTGSDRGPPDQLKSAIRTDAAEDTANQLVAASFCGLQRFVPGSSQNNVAQDLPTSVFLASPHAKVGATARSQSAFCGARGHNANSPFKYEAMICGNYALLLERCGNDR
jgi:hypothetical protein